MGWGGGGRGKNNYIILNRFYFIDIAILLVLSYSDIK